jgi:hypothetical protein
MARPALNALRSLSAAVAVGTGVSIAGLLVLRSAISLEALRGAADAVGNYVQTLGTIYAVLLAFVVFVVWSQFNDARAHVEREANELLDLFRTAKGLSAEARTGLQTHARDYVRSVVAREWAAMRASCEDRAVIDEGWAILERLWDVMHAYEPGTKCHEAIHGELMARFNDLSDARSLRLSSGRLKIPLALKILLYTGATLTIGSIYLIHVEQAWLHAFMTGAIAGAISHILYIVHDLDDVFDGDWIVTPEPFERVLAYMERTGAWSS